MVRIPLDFTSNEKDPQSPSFNVLLLLECEVFFLPTRILFTIQKINLSQVVTIPITSLPHTHAENFLWGTREEFGRLRKCYFPIVACPSVLNHGTPDQESKTWSA